MRIFHFYSDADPMMGEYVETLVSTIGNRAEMKATTSYSSLRKMCHDEHPDIIHVHGCWRMEMRHILPLAKKVDARVVVSPHGQLQPWVVKQRARSEKIPMVHLFQRKLVAKAYAVVVMGKMEAAFFSYLEWNPRIEMVKNALITESITKEEMAQQMLHIYNKVRDTAPRHYMLPSTVDALRALIKVGITGDRRFIDADHANACQSLSDEEWRKILLYAHQESILGTVALGIKNMNLPIPDIDPTKVEYYKKEQLPTPKGLKPREDDSPAKRISRKLRKARARYSIGSLSISYVVEVADALFHASAAVDEDELRELAFSLGAKGFMLRLMHILSTETLLDEGYLIAEPLDDKKTQKILRKILKYNEI